MSKKFKLSEIKEDKDKEVKQLRADLDNEGQRRNSEGHRHQMGWGAKKESKSVGTMLETACLWPLPQR